MASRAHTLAIPVATTMRCGGPEEQGAVDERLPPTASGSQMAGYPAPPARDGLPRRRGGLEVELEGPQAHPSEVHPREPSHPRGMGRSAHDGLQVGPHPADVAYR